MIIDKKITIKPLSLKDYYISKGYNVQHSHEEIEIIVSDLPIKSHKKILCKCDICENVVYRKYFQYLKNFNTYKIFTCSIKCSQIKVKKTSLEKYGVDNASKNDIIKNKIKKTNLEKYGVKYSIQSEEVKNKIKKTNLEKYGVEYSIQSEEVKNKIKETYGVEYISQSNIIKNKIRNRYLINRNNYYKDFFNKSEYDFISYETDELIFRHKICGDIFNIDINNYHNRNYSNNSLCTKCYPISENKSIKERKIINWLNEHKIEFIESDKNILKPKHLDIYIPSYNLAIEFNGLYHHSEIFKDKNYHLEKSLKCQEKGIQLLHIWEDEWVYKKDIVKSIILNKLGLIKEKIYARQCEIRVVDNSKLVRKFLDENHIQGYSQSSIKLGLFYQNELVSLMTFGYRHTNSKKEFELIRFCNRINLNVIGSASKLFNYFKQNYHFNELISYSDFRLFDGSMYQTLGFTKQHLSKPDYFWCKDIERKHRFNFNKQKLIKEGYDPNKTEVEIMYERGYYRIFGCGQYRWIFKNNETIK
jgi:hypothetical protein